MTPASLMLNNPYDIAESLASMTLRVADAIRDQNASDTGTAEIIENVATSVQQLLTAGRKLLEEGNTDEVLFCLGCAEGAVTLIQGLIKNPADHRLLMMAEPFITGKTEVIQ